MRRYKPWRSQPGKCPDIYTALYDIWCAQASDATLELFKPGDNTTYVKLLKVCKFFPDACSAGTAEEILGAQSLRWVQELPLMLAYGTNMVDELNDVVEEVDFDHEEDEADEEEADSSFWEWLRSSTCE
jgi:hypothetical protein